MAQLQRVSVTGLWGHGLCPDKPGLATCSQEAKLIVKAETRHYSMWLHWDGGRGDPAASPSSGVLIEGGV